MFKSFRDKHKHDIDFLNQELIKRFGMSLSELAEKLEPKPNLHANDPMFNWFPENNTPAEEGDETSSWS
jgi:hypothetical protein